MTRSTPANQQRLSYSEDDVRRLCGLAVFSQADAFQRAGHVGDVTRSGDLLSAPVRGVWRRVDVVSVQTRGGRLQPSCARHGATFCAHAGALLLQWLRAPEMVDITDLADERFRLLAGDLFGDLDDDDDGDLGAGVLDEAETPADELGRALSIESIAFIRAVARARGVRVSGSRKAEVVRDAALGLSDPANVDAALRNLDERAALLLDAVQLVLDVATSTTTEARAADAFRALGGTGSPPLDTLRDLGLVISPEPGYYQPREVFMPRAVAGRLGSRAGLAEPVDGAPPAPSDPSDSRPGLRLLSLLTVVAHDSLEFPPPDELTALDDIRLLSNLPDGFTFHPDDAEALATLARGADATGRVRLVSQSALRPGQARRIAEQTGQPESIVEFTGQLLISLGFADHLSGFSVDRRALDELFGYDPVDQVHLLAMGWLGVPGWIESTLIFGDGGALGWDWNPRFPAPPMSVAIASGVILTARLIGRLPADLWHTAASFAATVERLAPAGAPSLTNIRQLSQYLNLTWRGQRGAGREMALRSPQDWSLFVGAIVEAVLTGPLAWLDMVEVRRESGQVVAFRVRPSARVFRGQRLEPAELAGLGRATIEPDLTVVIPPGASSMATLAPILRGATLVGASADGLRYQLTAAAAQETFESGLSAGDVIRLLEAEAGAAIPRRARATLERWWRAYGQTRLYDELTLLELSDDLLLRELRAATAIERAILHQFTPRLIAIDEQAVDQVVSELTARGYAPRIVEDR